MQDDTSRTDTVQSVLASLNLQRELELWLIAQNKQSSKAGSEQFNPADESLHLRATGGVLVAQLRISLSARGSGKSEPPPYRSSTSLQTASETAFDPDKGILVDSPVKQDFKRPQDERIDSSKDVAIGERTSIWANLENLMSGTAAGDFLEQYSAMREANVRGADKYFHCMANCRATERGTPSMMLSVFVSNLREDVDVWKNLFRGMSFQESLADCLKDLNANATGRSGALTGVRCSEACHQFAPPRIGRRLFGH